MGRYKVDIAGIKTSSLKTLTNEEMKELFIKMHEGDTVCKDTLVNGIATITIDRFKNTYGCY